MGNNLVLKSSLDHVFLINFYLMQNVKKKTINNVKKVYAIFNSFGNHYLKENNDKFF